MMPRLPPRVRAPRNARLLAAAACALLVVAGAARAAPSGEATDGVVDADARSPDDDAVAAEVTIADEIVDAISDIDAWFVATEGYRLRGVTMSDDRGVDHDARLFLDAGMTTWGGRVSGAASTLVFWDVDGVQNRSGGLYSIRDQDGPVNVLVQSLDGRYADGGVVRRASVGRVLVLEGWPITLDGAAVSLAPLAFLGPGALLGFADSEVFFSAGRTVHFYETKPEQYEDWAAQLGTTLRFLRAFALTMDARVLVEDSASRGVDVNYGAALAVRGAPYVMGEVYARGLDENPLRFGGKGRFQYPAWEVGVDVSGDVQPLAIEEVHERENPYFSALGSLLPFARAHLEVWKRQDIVVGDLMLRGGLMQRARLFGEDEAFNRSYGNGYLAADVADFLLRGLSFGVSLGYHYLTTFTDDGLVTVGGVAAYQSRTFRVELGSDYQRYKYTYYQDILETADVRTFYGSVSVRLIDHVRLRGDYQVEIFDRVVHTANVSLVQDFGLGGGL